MVEDCKTHLGTLGDKELVDLLLEKDDRLRVIHKENGGLSDARNAGLEIASGDYIAFVDSDDFVEPGFIQVLMENLEKYSADVSCCRYANVWEDGRREPVGEDHQICVYEGTDGLREYLYGKTMDPFVWNKLYRRELIGQTRFIKGIVGEDNPFNYEIFAKKPKTVLAGEANYNYLQARKGAITYGVPSPKRIDSVFRWETIRQQCLADYPDLEPYALRRQTLFYVGLYNSLIREKQYLSERQKIKVFLKEHYGEIKHNSLFERTVKTAVFLLVYFPHIYIIVMRLYKKVIGEAKL